MKKGFTLIELLVVVLIIGILAAIAVPQYTKAVEKSRMSEVLTMIRSLEQAVDVHVLANGIDSYNIDVLADADIDLENLTSREVSNNVPARCSKDWCYLTACHEGTYCAVGAARVTEEYNGVGRGNVMYGMTSMRNLDGEWTKTYQICKWSGGDIFSSLRALGYTEDSCRNWW